MGSCVSVNKNHLESAMKDRLPIGCKANTFVIPSPTKETKMNGGKGIAGFDSQSKNNFGSKDETFFDTQVWLESDCEEDFISVNGDFTPSGCSTPNYERSVPGTPQLNKAFSADRTLDRKPETSPTNKKKRLADLFRESLRGEQEPEDQNTDSKLNAVNRKLDTNKTNLETPQKSSEGTPYLSGANSLCGSERTPNKDSKHEKDRTVKHAQCCLPSLVQSLSFSERKKQLSPMHQNGG